MKKKIWKSVLSKDGNVFETESFRSLDEAIRWSEQLRFEDNYMVSIYRGREHEPSVQYICSRSSRNLDYTTNLFSAFR